MKNHLKILAALLSQGWKIRAVNGHYEYRSPCGMSGSEYHAPDLETLPLPVEEWVRNSDIITIAQTLFW
jgi:hypothetical protein